jgi:hypothetical protein
MEFTCLRHSFSFTACFSSPFERFLFSDAILIVITSNTLFPSASLWFNLLCSKCFSRCYVLYSDN